MRILIFIMRILIFGDSITYGVWDEQGGWTQRFRKLLDQQNLADLSKELKLVYNLGITKDTSEDIRSRFESETNSRKREGERLLTIIAVGTNDSAYSNEMKTTRVPAGRFKSNLEWLIKKSRDLKATPVLVGLIGVDESKTKPLYWNYNLSYRDNLISEYNLIILEVADSEKVPFVDFFTNLKDRKDLLYDGLHPNAEGHKIISESIFEYLKDEEII